MQSSWLGHFMRESSLWTYAIVNLAHVLGISTLFGSILVLDLRLVGIGRRLPLAAVSSAVVPVATAGFLIYVADSSGYLGSVALLLWRDLAVVKLDWLRFFILSAYTASVLGLALVACAALYFLRRRAEPLAAVSSAVTP